MAIKLARQARDTRGNPTTGEHWEPIEITQRALGNTGRFFVHGVFQLFESKAAFDRGDGPLRKPDIDLGIARIEGGPMRVAVSAGESTGASMSSRQMFDAAEDAIIAPRDPNDPNPNRRGGALEGGAKVTRGGRP